MQFHPVVSLTAMPTTPHSSRVFRGCSPGWGTSAGSRQPAQQAGAGLGGRGAGSGAAEGRRVAAEAGNARAAAAAAAGAAGRAGQRARIPAGEGRGVARQDGTDPFSIAHCLPTGRLTLTTCCTRRLASIWQRAVLPVVTRRRSLCPPESTHSGTPCAGSARQLLRRNLWGGGLWHKGAAGVGAGVQRQNSNTSFVMLHSPLGMRQLCLLDEAMLLSQRRLKLRGSQSFHYRARRSSDEFA